MVRLYEGIFLTKKNRGLADGRQSDEMLIKELYGHVQEKNQR